MITRQIKTMSWEKPYVSPEIKELEIKSEGMLCQSLPTLMWDRADAGYDDFNDLGDI